MQGPWQRCLILLVVLGIGTLLQAGADQPRAAAPTRWPTDAAVYDVGVWEAGPLQTELVNGVRHVTRAYQRPDGTRATLAISTSPVAKAVYGAGAEVPFLSSGYTADPAPAGLVPPAPGRGALLVQRDGVVSLLLHATGERRGLLGSGLLGWSMALTDAVLGRPNDYYVLRILVQLDRLDSPLAREAAQLADTLFPRLASWYAA